MKRALSALSLALVLPLNLPALADMNHMGSGSASGHAAMAGMLSDGKVKKVNKSQGKLTIRHGPLTNLDMPAMTMIFSVQNPAMIDRVKPGDQSYQRSTCFIG